MTDKEICAIMEKLDGQEIVNDRTCGFSENSPRPLGQQMISDDQNLRSYVRSVGACTHGFASDGDWHQEG